MNNNPLHKHYRHSSLSSLCSVPWLLYARAWVSITVYSLSPQLSACFYNLGQLQSEAWPTAELLQSWPAAELALFFLLLVAAALAAPVFLLWITDSKCSTQVLVSSVDKRTFLASSRIDVSESVFSPHFATASLSRIDGGI